MLRHAQHEWFLFYEIFTHPEPVEGYISICYELGIAMSRLPFFNSSPFASACPPKLKRAKTGSESLGRVEKSYNFGLLLIFLSTNFTYVVSADKKIASVNQKKINKPVPKNKRMRVDGIKAVVRGSSGADLILESELRRPKLDGTPNTLDSSITNSLIKQEADRLHITQTPEENQKQYEMIAQNNKKTVKELDEMVMQAGFTPQEARKEFGQINAVNSLLGWKVGGMVVPESEVRAYYEENPEYESAAYQIQMVVVPFSSTQTREQQLTQLQTLANAQDPNGVLNWIEPFWVNEEDLAADKKFITELEPGQISLPKEVFNGFQMFRLVAKKEKRLKTFDDRYGQIVSILRQPKYNELMTKFQQELKDNASIIIFDLPE